MRKIREILRLKLDARLSRRAIARGANVSQSTVSEYVGRALVAKLSWPLPPDLDDDQALERRLFPAEHHPVARRPEPDWSWVHRELKRKHVTRMLLWQEYREGEPAGLEYSQFCDRYREWAKRLPVTMRQEHRAGEKLFVDFSGDGIEIVDRVTGEVVVAKLFVAVLGASNYTYVEPVLREDLPTWIGCHVRAFGYFGGAPEIVVPDNLKSGGEAARLLRTRSEPDLRGPRRALRRGGDPGASVPSSGQGSGFTLRLLPHVRSKLRVLASITETFARPRRGKRSGRGLEEKVSSVVTANGAQHAIAGEVFGGLTMDPELGRHLYGREPAGAAEMLEQAVDAIAGVTTEVDGMPANEGLPRCSY